MLRDVIEQIQNDLRSGRFTNEATVSQGIVLPVLYELGWPVFDTRSVAPEYALEGRRVDFALCDGSDRPKVFLEVKRVGQAEGRDRQLFEYAFHRGVPVAILTDGQEWSFYLPGEEGHYEERRVYKIDLLERDAMECDDRLTRYLGHMRVMSGETLEAARTDYRDAARLRQITATLPRAWAALLESQDALLIELLADKVEDMCGYKPDPDTCSQFLSALAAARSAPTPGRVRPVSTPPRGTSGAAPVPRGFAQSALSQVGFSFQGSFCPARSAREVMQGVLRLLAEADQTFLDRFTARKHGKKRRFVARGRAELYPGRPDLADYSVEFVPGWWMGTNYSKRSITEIIQLACEVAGVPFGTGLRINLG